MIRVLLVDDSPLFCAQFQGLAKWESLGIDIQHVARNGSDAIEWLSHARPDVILTDINMPVMGGIGLIEYVRANYPQIPIIALSAYDDFDYVRDSLKSGASDYILKHQLDPDKLAALLRREVRPGAPEADGAAGREAQAQAFFALVLSGWFAGGEEIDRRMRELGITFPEHGAVPVLAGLDGDGGAAGSAFTEPMIQLLRESLKPRLWACARLRDDMTLLIMRMTHEGQVGYNLAEALRASSVTLGRFFGASLSFSVGEGIDRLSALPAQVSRLREQYDAMRFLGRRQFLATRQESGREGINTLSLEDERRLAEAVGRGDRQGVCALLDGLFSALQLRGVAPMDISMLYAALINVLIRAGERAGIDPAAAGIPAASDFDSIGAMQNWCRERFDRLIDALFGDGGGYNAYVRQAIAYIHAHYADRIPLRGIARAVGLSESYLSRMFKDETGVNIVSYINNVRVDAAERLLTETDLPLKEIALRVGIANYNHFFSLYRERKGCTPTDSRARRAPGR